MSTASNPRLNGDRKPLIPALASHRHSRPVPAHLLEGYFLQLEPRIHHIADEEERENDKIQNDWLNLGGCSMPSGSLSKAGGFMSLVFPEALPERVLKFFGLAAIGFIEDDWMDGDMLASEVHCSDTDETDYKMRTYGNIIKQMKSRIIVELLRQDAAIMAFVQSCDNWTSRCLATGNLAHQHFKNLEEYLNEGLVIVGAELNMILGLYCYDIKFTNGELDMLGPINQVAYRLCVLINDLYSVEKEWLTHATLGKPGVPVSSVYLIMSICGVCVAEAKEIIKQKCLALEQSFLHLHQRFSTDFSQTPEIIRYLSSLQLIVSGNALWHLNHTRYIVDLNTAFRVDATHTIQDLPRQKLKHQPSDKSPELCMNGPFITRLEATNGVGSGSSVPKSMDGWLRPSSCHADPNSVKEVPPLSPRTSWLVQYSRLPDKLILEPFNYVASLPSKGIRNIAVEALDIWYRVPQRSLNTIQSVIDMLHSSSLILDDIEDNSAIRRGNPSTHMVFGASQAINTANYLFVKCLDSIQSLSSAAIKIYSDELRHRHTGQAYDLHWTFHAHCPSEEEYIKMIDGKTGGLFRMASRLMRAEATQNRNLEVEDLLTIMGRFFQIRDDYQNFRSRDYSTAKGLLSDLDEGKYSFIIIHALGKPENGQLRSIFQLRCRQGYLTPQQKTLVMKILARLKSLEYTLDVLNELRTEIEKMLEMLEATAGAEKNWMMRAIMARLAVSNPTLHHLRV